METRDIIILGIVGFFIVYTIYLYNKLITLRNNRDNSFADIDVQLQQRADLIPQLIETVKGYMNHEKDVLENVTKARTSFLNSNTVDEKVDSGNQLEGALKSLFAVSENYPDLKASQNFQQLQSEMSDIENKLAAARRYFNSSTKELNTYVEMFPSNMVAKMFGFNQKEYFEVEDREQLQQPPEVSFK